MSTAGIIIALFVGIIIPIQLMGAVHYSMAAPVIHKITPSSTTASAKAFTISISGTNFATGVKVFWGSSELNNVRLYGDSLVKVEIPALLNQETSIVLTLTNPDFQSATRTFVIAPKPYWRSVSS